jgi:hypothetical protein
VTDIPDFARARMEPGGPIAAANDFLEAIQTGDVEAACRVSVPEFHERLRSGFADELRQKWSDVDGSWGWITNRRVLEGGLEIVWLIEKGETGYVTEPTDTNGIPFVMQGTDRWLVYALEAPPEALEEFQRPEG